MGLPTSGRLSMIARAATCVTCCRPRSICRHPASSLRARPSVDEHRRPQSRPLRRPGGSPLPQAHADPRSSDNPVGARRHLSSSFGIHLMSSYSSWAGGIARSGASLLLAASLAVSLQIDHAFAHAHLETARPGVGTTVATSPQTIEIDFSEGVVPRFSGIAVRDAAGKPVAVANRRPARRRRPLSCPSMHRCKPAPTR